ncbi:hypothetical protein V1527DRAFT_499538 [Lipomyces starkeyi]
MTGHSDLLDIVGRPISPDVRLEVQTTRKQYPKLRYDGTRNVAIVVGPPSELHGKMAGGLLASIIRGASKQQGLSEDVKDRLTLATEMGNTRGRTTRGWDGTLEYQEGNPGILMIAVGVGVSQAYESLRAAISRSVCALHCRLGIAMCIREKRRGETPDLHWSFLEEENAVVAEAEEDFRNRASIRQVILKTYRVQDVDLPTGTFLDPSQSFTVVDDGERSLLRPSTFSVGTWFEEQFGDGMVRTAANRMRPRPPVCKVV